MYMIIIRTHINYILNFTEDGGILRKKKFKKKMKKK